MMDFEEALERALASRAHWAADIFGLPAGAGEFHTRQIVRAIYGLPQEPLPGSLPVVEVPS